MYRRHRQRSFCGTLVSNSCRNGRGGKEENCGVTNGLSKKREDRSWYRKGLYNRHLDGQLVIFWIPVTTKPLWSVLYCYGTKRSSSTVGDKDVPPEASCTAMIRSSSTACDKHVPPEDKYELILMAVAAVVLNWAESEIRQRLLQGPRDLIARVERLIFSYYPSKVT